MISQETSRNLYESLKDIRTKGIKELIENPVLTKEDAALSKIIARMIKENAHEVFIQLPDDKSVSCINIRDILLATNSESLKSSSIKVTMLSSSVRLGIATFTDEDFNDSLYVANKISLMFIHDMDLSSGSWINTS